MQAEIEELSRKAAEDEAALLGVRNHADFLRGAVRSVAAAGAQDGELAAMLLVSLLDAGGEQTVEQLRLGMGATATAAGQGEEDADLSASRVA